MATDTRTRLIETTARLIQARGFHGVSLNDILAESGAPRGSLYFHFPGGKESLVLEAMLAGIAQATAILKACLGGARHPADGVRAFFQAAEREMAESDFLFGCPVAPIILDTPEVGSDLADACRAALAEWKDLYRQALSSAGVPHGRAERLARTVLASLEGALIMARSERDPRVIGEIGNEVAAWLLAATRPRSRA